MRSVVCVLFVGVLTIVVVLTIGCMNKTKRFLPSDIEKYEVEVLFTDDKGFSVVKYVDQFRSQHFYVRPPMPYTAIVMGSNNNVRFDPTEKEVEDYLEQEAKRIEVKDPDVAKILRTCLTVFELTRRHRKLDDKIDGLNKKLEELDQ